jgi:hypothetical protein
MIDKQILVLDRDRRQTSKNWSRFDRRFICEVSSKFSGDVVFSYRFLTSIVDENGLSHCSDKPLAFRLRTRA